MRRPQREVVALCRGLHTSARAPTARPLQRTFHQTSPAFRPRQRTFFTSNPLLAKDGNDDSPSPTSTASSPSSPSPSPSPAVDQQPEQPPQSRSNNRKKSTSTATTTATATSTAAAAAAAKASVAAKKSLSNPLRRVVNIAQRPGRKPAKGAKDGEAESEQAEDDGRTQIRAICVAESFDMEAVVKILTDHWYQLDPDGLGFDTLDVVHARGSGGEGDVFIFPSGTVVTWSLPADVGISMATGMLSKAALNANLESAERESLEFETDGSMSTSTMRKDKVVLGTRAPEDDGSGGDRTYPTLAKIAFSSGLARSTKIAFLEALLSAYFKKTKDIPMQLEAGRLAVTKKFILQRTGELLNLRSQLNLYSELTDSLPDMFWDQSSELRLENNYDQVGRALDVLDRIKLLNQRMDYAQEMATVMRGMSDSDHSAYLEKIIIWLILIEVIFEIRRIFTEYREAWKKEDEEEAPERATG